MTSSAKSRFAFLLSAPLLSALACSGGSDLPEGWDGAKEIPLQQSQCEDATKDVEFPEPQINLLESETEAVFYMTARCDQELCAYHIDEEGPAKVLVQPCEMNPKSVPRCGCHYRVELSFALPQGDVVQIWSGTDEYASPAEQTLIEEAAFCKNCLL